MEGVWGQSAGQQSFTFLELPASARQQALGGVNVSSQNGGGEMFWMNPALFSKESGGQVSLNYYDYYADIGQTTLAYGQSFGKSGFWSAGFQYWGYGDIMGTSSQGNTTVGYKPSSYAITLSSAHSIRMFALGANLTFAQDNFFEYSASALVLDFGGVYYHPEYDWTVGLTVENAGFILSGYTPGDGVSLPFDARLGTTFKPEGFPLRVSLTYQGLQQFDQVQEIESGQIDALGNPIQEESSFADKLSRHLVFGGEFVVGKIFNVWVSYNIQHRREMVLQNFGGVSGFAFGTKLKVKSFNLAYARGWNHSVGGTNSFSIIFDTKSLLVKKKRVID
ncbi:hypothetical protein GCM10023331_34050 [Algivirga pacifica]|uniref:Type IX secretion system protein PorQ n=2 Tax=Algivirga pacifica TaxID=1162670 RepID=A0ABP9DIU5_9BACT